MHDLKKWIGIEESVFRQKSRASWLKLGDENNRFFFSVMKSRHAGNRIDSIYTSFGVKLIEPQAIQDEIIGFYKSLMGINASTFLGVDLSTIRAGTQLSATAYELLYALVITDDVDRALASIGDDKAPGIYGMSAVFFKRAWSVIANDIYNVVLDFFNTTCMLKHCNITTITLVPKVTNPTYAKDFRPIACCTMVFKIIAKILASRLAKVVGEVVNDAQTGFIPGKYFLVT